MFGTLGCTSVLSDGVIFGHSLKVLVFQGLCNVLDDRGRIVVKRLVSAELFDYGIVARAAYSVNTVAKRSGDLHSSSTDE